MLLINWRCGDVTDAMRTRAHLVQQLAAVITKLIHFKSSRCPICMKFLPGFNAATGLENWQQRWLSVDEFISGGRGRGKALIRIANDNWSGFLLIGEESWIGGANWRCLMAARLGNAAATAPELFRATAPPASSGCDADWSRLLRYE